MKASHCDVVLPHIHESCTNPSQFDVFFIYFDKKHNDSQQCVVENIRFYIGRIQVDNKNMKFSPL